MKRSSTGSICAVEAYYTLCVSSKSCDHPSHFRVPTASDGELLDLSNCEPPLLLDVSCSRRFQLGSKEMSRAVRNRRNSSASLEDCLTVSSCSRLLCELFSASWSPHTGECLLFRTRFERREMNKCRLAESIQFESISRARAHGGHGFRTFPDSKERHSHSDHTDGQKARNAARNRACPGNTNAADSGNSLTAVKIQKSKALERKGERS